MQRMLGHGVTFNLIALQIFEHIFILIRTNTVCVPDAITFYNSWRPSDDDLRKGYKIVAITTIIFNLH